MTHSPVEETINGQLLFIAWETIISATPLQPTSQCPKIHPGLNSFFPHFGRKEGQLEAAVSENQVVP